MFQQFSLLQMVWSVTLASPPPAHAVKTKRDFLVSLSTLSGQIIPQRGSPVCSGSACRAGSSCFGTLTSNWGTRKALGDGITHQNRPMMKNAPRKERSQESCLIKKERNIISVAMLRGERGLLTAKQTGSQLKQQQRLQQLQKLKYQPKKIQYQLGYI